MVLFKSEEGKIGPYLAIFFFFFSKRGEAGERMLNFILLTETHSPCSYVTLRFPCSSRTSARIALLSSSVLKQLLHRMLMKSSISEILVWVIPEKFPMGQPSTSE